MKKSRKVLLGAATLAAVMAVGQEANAAKDTLQIDAKIIAALMISATKALDFGTAYETGTGTLQIKTDGSSNPSGTITVTAGSFSEGGFKIKGGNALKADITLPKTATLSHTVTATKTMKVTAFRVGTGSVAAIAGTPFVQTLNGTWQASIPVGGTLNIAAGQTTGVYSGTAQITAVYQ